MNNTPTFPNNFVMADCCNKPKTFEAVTLTTSGLAICHPCVGAQIAHMRS